MNGIAFCTVFSVGRCNGIAMKIVRLCRQGSVRAVKRYFAIVKNVPIFMALWRQSKFQGCWLYIAHYIYLDFFKKTLVLGETNFSNFRLNY